MSNEVKHTIKLLEFGKPSLNNHDSDSNHDSDRALEFNFGIKDGMVIVDFGKAVKWIGLSPDDALQFVQIMVKIAKQIVVGGTKEHVDVNQKDKPS